MGGLYTGGAYLYIRTRFCVSNISHLLTLFLYNTRLIYKQAYVYIRVGSYTGGLIFGMVRVLVNGWAYTWGAYIRGAYIRRFTVYEKSRRKELPGELARMAY